MFYGGESNVPGAPGNLLAGSPGYFPSDQEIQNRLFQYGLKNTPQGQQIQQNIRRLQEQNPNIFGARLAQAFPGNLQMGGQMGGQIGAEGLGDPLMMGPPQFSLRPRIDVTDDQLTVGGSAVVPLGSNNMIGVRGNYIPETKAVDIQGTIGKPQGTPGFGVDFGYRRTPRTPADIYGGLRYSQQF